MNASIIITGYGTCLSSTRLDFGITVRRLFVHLFNAIALCALIAVYPDFIAPNKLCVTKRRLFLVNGCNGSEDECSAKKKAS